MEKLKNKYQLAIIPKDTILFRKAPDNKVYESMFFSFDTYGTYSSDYTNTPTQIWVTRLPILSRLIIKDKITPEIYDTDLEYCYHKFCGEQEYYLNIKTRKNPKFKPFLEYLKRNDINSWVTSVENNTCMELHLFTDKNKNLVKFKELVDNEKNRTLVNKDTFGNVILINPNDHI